MIIALSKSKRIVHKQDIPQDMRSLKILNPNSGATCIVLEKDSDTVYVLTRDTMKKEWLVNGLMLGTKVQELNFYNHRLGKLGQEPVYCIEMPKLFPLDTTNKKKVQGDVKVFQTIYTKYHMEYYSKSVRREIQSQDIVRLANEDTREDLESKWPQNILIPYLMWASNYEQYYNDIGVRNFAQDSKRQIVVLDPIVSKQVINYLQGVKQ